MIPLIDHSRNVIRDYPILCPLCSTRGHCYTASEHTAYLKYELHV